MTKYLLRLFLTLSALSIIHIPQVYSEDSIPVDSVITSIKTGADLDTVFINPVDSTGVVPVDTSRWAKDPILWAFRRYLEPAAYVLVLGGILYILFSQRGR
jgi:hypothetical protein